MRSRNIAAIITLAVTPVAIGSAQGADPAPRDLSLVSTNSALAGVTSVIERPGGQIFALDTTRRVLASVSAFLEEGNSQPLPAGRIGRLQPGRGDSAFAAAARSDGFHLIKPDGTFGPFHPVVGGRGLVISTSDLRLAMSPTRELFQVATPSSDSAVLFNLLPDGTTSAVVTLRVQPLPVVRIGVQAGTSAATGGKEFFPIDAWVPLPDGRVAVVRGDPYRLDIVSVSGDEVRGKPIPFTAWPVTEADKDAVRAQRVADRKAMIDRLNGFSFGTGGVPTLPSTPEPTWGRSKPAIADSRPILATDGTIWVRRYDQDQNRQRWDVLSVDGLRVDHVRLPAGASLVGVGRALAFVHVEGALATFSR